MSAIIPLILLYLLTVLLQLPDLLKDYIFLRQDNYRYILYFLYDVLFAMALPNTRPYVQVVYYDIFNILLDECLLWWHMWFVVLRSGPDMFTFNYLYVFERSKDSPCGFWKYVCLFYKYENRLRDIEPSLRRCFVVSSYCGTIT